MATVSLLSDVLSMLPTSLTRPGALAQLSSVDGLGELGYLVILIFHMHSHKLWTPQDLSILRLQGDLEGKGSWFPSRSCLLALPCVSLCHTWSWYSAFSSRSRALVATRKPESGSTAKVFSAAVPESPDRTI